MFGYQVPSPDQAMLISGGRVKEGAPFRVITGRGAWVMPFFRKASKLTLAMQEAEVEEECVTHQGITLRVRAVIAFKVGADPEFIVNAGQRFLSDQAQMEKLTGRIFAGHLRSIIGSMTVEEIVTERQKLAEQVLEGSKEEMARLGLVVDALQIQSIDDGEVGYIKAMSAPHNAQIQQLARTAEAKANETSAKAEQESERKRAEYERETAVAKAGYKAEVDKASAQAAQAGPLQEADSRRAVVEKETTLAEQNAELREQQLQAETIKPAEANAKAMEIAAGAEAKKTEVLAAAAASNDRVALDRMLIEQLPQIVTAAGSALSHADLTILNGSDGLSELVAGLASQGGNILEIVKKAATENGWAPTGGEDPDRQPALMH